MTIHSVVIQKLLSTNAHLGRRVAANHFKIYSCGTRNAMTIIDSDKTLICLRNACNFIGNLVRVNGRLLFVNTNTLFDEIIEQMTKTIGIKNDTSWRLGGFLTNSSSPRKFRGRNKKLNLTSLRAPDCVVIFDTERKSSVIVEANRLQIPIVGLVDSSMPWETYKKITYPVPANDSVQFVYLFCNLITKTILYEQKRLKAAMGSAAKEVSGSESGTREDAPQIKKTNTISYESLQPVSEDISDIKHLLDKVVVLKLNDTLGTNMGFSGPRCTLEVHDGMTCLDLIINQIESLNTKYGCSIPLLLANTTNTHDATLKVLERHSDKNIDTFIQDQHLQEDSSDALSQDRMSISNHSEVFSSLKESGKLDELMSQGKEYVLVMNSDNLAHVVDPRILNHLMEKNVDTCMEVVPASSDLEENGLLSTAEQHEMSKENVKPTETKWFSMTSIGIIAQRSALHGSFTMSKLFAPALTIKVPKSRHFPVERTSDLLLFQSDLYTFVDGVPKRNAARSKPVDPVIELGPEFAKVSDFHRRFKSKPSIIELDKLEVTGNVWFGSDVTLKGKVIISARLGMKIVIPDGTVLENRVISSSSEL